MNGNEIRQARERAGLTQGELGERVGVSGRTVGNWERDFSIPRNKLAKVEQVLNVREYLGKESKLQDVSDASLLAEIARRFDEGRTREKAGEGNADSPTPMNQAGGKPAPEAGPTADELEELRRRQQKADETPLEEILGYAAHAPGTESEKQRLDREAAERGEESQDD